MIDIHSHLVFSVDDGPFSRDESIKMVCEAEESRQDGENNPWDS